MFLRMTYFMIQRMERFKEFVSLNKLLQKQKFQIFSVLQKQSNTKPSIHKDVPFLIYYMPFAYTERKIFILALHNKMKDPRCFRF